MKIIDRYATAIHSRDLSVDEKTTMSDTDVLAAMALADKTLTDGYDRQGNAQHKAPLAVALTRLFYGDNNASARVVEVLADMGWRHARGIGVKVNRVQAADLARASLAWHRNGACRNCGGHGYGLIPGTTTVGTHKCGVCDGSGKIPFEKAIDDDGTRIGLRELARWMVAQMERDMARAGPAAMVLLAKRMEL